MTRNGGSAGVIREFVGLPSPTAGRAGAGGHPCQGLYHRGVGRKPKVAMSSLKVCASPARAWCDQEKTASPNIRWAAAVPAKAPPTWAIR